MSEIKQTCLYKKTLKEVVAPEIMNTIKKALGSDTVNILGYDYTDRGSEGNDDNSKILKNLDDKFQKLDLCTEFLKNIPGELSIVEQNNHLEYHLSFLQKEIASIFDILLKLIKYNYNLTLSERFYYNDIFLNSIDEFPDLKNKLISIRGDKTNSVAGKYENIFDEQNFIKHARNIVVSKDHSISQAFLKTVDKLTKKENEAYNNQVILENSDTIKYFVNIANNFKKDVVDIIEQVCLDIE